MNISVIIPTLNESENIGECISIINNQINSNDEVMVVDGGSTDGTKEIARDLGAVVIEGVDIGIGLSRHIGVTEAKGDIIATTDADARPPDDWISTIRTHFEEDEELSVLWGSVEDRNGVPIRDMTGKFSTLTGGASGNNTAFRRQHYIDNTTGYPDVDYAEDAIIIYKLALRGKAIRDESMVMTMDMDRTRYQTVPIVVGSAGLLSLGLIYDSEYSSFLTGSAIGLAGTELIYETATDSPMHHDEFGIILSVLGSLRDSGTLTGVGAGLFTHHLVTEGLSMVPTILHRETDKIFQEN